MKITTKEELINAYENEQKSIFEMQPPDEWLKENEEVLLPNGKPEKYLPIDKVNFLLRTIFRETWTEVAEIRHVQNSVHVVARIFVVEENGKEKHIDGIGSAQSRDGLTSASAKAYSMAIKNAVKQLGAIFGRDLRRLQEEAAILEMKEKAEKEKQKRKSKQQEKEPEEVDCDTPLTDQEQKIYKMLNSVNNIRMLNAISAQIDAYILKNNSINEIISFKFSSVKEGLKTPKKLTPRDQFVSSFRESLKNT